MSCYGNPGISHLNTTSAGLLFLEAFSARGLDTAMGWPTIKFAPSATSQITGGLPAQWFQIEFLLSEQIGHFGSCATASADAITSALGDF